MTLNYQIVFYDYWHLSSGLSAGAKLDSTVVKDNNNLPYVPAKTIKGLIKEMAELLDDEVFLVRCFGIKGMQMGKCYFANAVLNLKIKEQIISNKLQDNLYDVIASTKIDEKGMAVDNSLREIEVVIPLTFEGQILDISTKEDGEKLIQSMKAIRRMGLNRNRGLGRCEFIVGDLA